MAVGTLSPLPKFTGFDNNGAIIPAGKLFTYYAGTTTKIATYTDVGLTLANPNPIILDSAARATIFLTGGNSYKFVLAPSTDTDPFGNPIWTQDNISTVATTSSSLDILGTAGATITAGQVVYLSAGLGGGTAGKWYPADSTNSYSSVAANCLGVAPSAISSGAAGTIRLIGGVSGLSSLTAGSLYYLSTAGTLSTTPGTYYRPFCVADSTTSIVIPNEIPPSTQGCEVLYSNWTAAASINGTTDLMSFTVPGGILARTGQYLHIHSDFEIATNNSGQIAKVMWNGASVSGNINIANQNPNFAYLDVYIGKTGASTQQISGYWWTGRVNGFPLASVSTPFNTTGSGTDTAGIIFKLNCTCVSTTDLIERNLMISLLSL